MKNTLATIVLAIVILIYTVLLLAIHRIRMPWQDPIKTHRIEPVKEYTYDSIMVVATPVKFVAIGRDPFAFDDKTNVVKKVKKNERKSKNKIVRKSVNKQVAKKNSKPEMTISGIIWDQDKPAAMLKLENGETKTVEEKQKVGNMIIKKIRKKSIIVTIEGNDVIIDTWQVMNH